MTRPVVAVDFDGVIHQYTGWDGNPPRGKPVEGIQAGLTRLKDAGFSLVVHTAREVEHVWNWLHANALGHFFSDVTNTKPKEAIVFFDDRAVLVPSNVEYGLDKAARMFLLGYLAHQTT